MSEITVQAGEIDNYLGSETVPKLRIFVSKNFVASDGDTIPRSSPETGDFYVEVACTVALGVISYAAFVLDSTTDALSNPSDAKYRIDLYSATNQYIQNLFKNLRVPTTTPTTIGTLASYNDENVSPPPVGTYTTTQTDAAIAAAVLDRIIGSGIAKITVSTSAPVGSAVGDFWLDSDN